MRAGIAPGEAAIDVDVYARTILGWDRARILAESSRARPGQLEPTFSDWLARRERFEPTAYIVGEREFWGLDFAVTPAVLDSAPGDRARRRGTALAAARARGRAPRIADIGTGSGCIAVAVAHETRRCTVRRDRRLGTRRSTVARQNAARHGVADRIEFVCTSYLDGVEGPFDLIAANPPYVRDVDRRGLSRDVLQEPHVALFGGDDGLRDIEARARRRVVAARPRRLAASWSSGSVRKTTCGGALAARDAGRSRSHQRRAPTCRASRRVTVYHSTPMSDCLFCKIVAGEIPGQLVHEDEDLVAFKDINPQAPLHVLIVPQTAHRDVERPRTRRRRARGRDVSARGGAGEAARLRRARLPHGVQLQSRRGADGVPHPPAPAGRARPRAGHRDRARPPRRGRQPSLSMQRIDVLARTQRACSGRLRTDLEIVDDSLKASSTVSREWPKRASVTRASCMTSPPASTSPAING